MLQVASALKGYAIVAEDGPLGTVRDLLFDDRTWAVRWLVVEAGTWLTGRKVLVHPQAIGPMDHGRRELSVSLTKAQIKDSPDVSEDRPVSQQMQNEVYDYYGWNPAWGEGMYGGMYGMGAYGPGLFGGNVGAIASPLSAAPYFGSGAVREAEHPGHGFDEGDPHLRSIAEVTGYHVHAADGNIGHVEDFLVATATWGIHYLVVNTSNWWVGQHVMISPRVVREVDWPDRHIRLDLARAQVRSSPSWNLANEATGEFEKQAQGHYHWPGYGGQG